MFHSLGRLAASHPWLVCAAWIVVGVALTLYAPNWDNRTQDDDIRFLPERCASVRGYQLLQQAFPQNVFASRLIFAIEREDRQLGEADYALVDQLIADLEQLGKEAPGLKLGSITSYQDGVIGSRLRSQDGHCTLIIVSLGTPFLAVQTQTTVDRVEALLRQRLAQVPDPPRLFTTGNSGIGRDLVQACGDSLDNTTLATIILVVVVLLLVYRAPLLALVPLITIGASVWVALHLLAFMTLIPGVHMVNVSKIFAIVILYGAGTDYCLFLISRYREELENGQPNVLAVSSSVGAVGGALTASAATVMCGLGLMALAEFAKVRYSGPGIALSLLVALIGSLTLTPALLRILGKAVFWPWSPPAPRPLRVLRDSGADRGLWHWLSKQVVAHPGLIWLCSVLLLLPLAVLGFQVHADYRATSQLSPSSQSLQGLQVLQKHFTAGETGPLTVLLVSHTDWNSRIGRLEIDHLTRGFSRLDNVAEVRSLTQPLGSATPAMPTKNDSVVALASLLDGFRPNLVQDMLKAAQDSARKHYVRELPDDKGDPAKKRYVTRLDIILKSDPFDAASVNTMQMVQTWLRSELPRTSLLGKDIQGECYGVMVNAHDLAQVTESDRLRVNSLITVGIFLILLVIVRRPLMALYLLLTVLLSYWATLGATVLMGWVWLGEPLYQLDWRVMFFLFVILMAVGEDYNILLMSRAVQEQKRHGLIEGMRRALARTGGTITSCGLIMAGTFATLMLANLNTLLQIGFALAFGVLLDTFVVRPFLVPTFVILLGQEPKRKTARAEPETSRLRDIDEFLAALRRAG